MRLYMIGVLNKTLSHAYMIDTGLYLSNKYLTKYRCVIHLVVVMLSG